MKKDSKQRLFEVMGRLDKTFKPKMNESIPHKTFTINLWGEEEEVYLDFDIYQNNNALAVQLVTVDGEPYATISTNLPESASLSPTEFFLKDWSENEPIADALIQKGIIKPTGKQASSGFVTAKSYTVVSDYLEEGWGKNLAAGAMMGAASMMPMNVQAQQNTGVDKNKTEISTDKDAKKFQKRYQSYEIAVKEYEEFKKENPNYDSNRQIYNELVQWKKELDAERNKTYKYGS